MKRTRQRLSRRALLRSAMAGGAGLLAAYAVGCNNESDRQPTPASTRLSAPTEGTTPAAVPTETPLAGPRWRQLTSSGMQPPPRRDHSLVAVGQRQLFVFGGRSSGPLGDLWSFDMIEGSWTQVQAPDGPPARFGHNAVYDGVNGRMVVFGGQSAGGAFFDDIWAFHMAFDVAGVGTWARLKSGEVGPSARYGAAGALDPTGRLLISHGFTDAGRFDDTWGFDLAGESWTEASPQGARPLERCLMRSVWDPSSGRLLMFGGQSTGIPFLGDLWELTKDGWFERTAEPKPSPRDTGAPRCAASQPP